MKLELTWSGKEAAMDISSIPMRTFKDGKTVGTGADGVLIHGDNLDALRALLPMCRNKVRCIFIDPPYNTGHAFNQYDDALEHSEWLNMMAPRLILLRQLLSHDGSIWITIDDDEGHYLKLLCDEIFGRQNFISNVIWEKKYSPQNDAKWLSDTHDHILAYAKNKTIWRPNLLPRTEEANARYTNRDNDPRGPWKSSDFMVKTYSATTDYPITTPSGRVITLPPGKCWSVKESRFKELVADNRIWFGENGNGVPSLKRFLSDVKQGMVSKTIWKREEVGDTHGAKNEIKALFPEENPFDTPKPERLLQRIIHLASNPGDLILDSFLGSATTCAVAHKMGRRWVGIEMGDHFDQCVERMKKVVDGEQGGISKEVNWNGGGGFNVRTLGKTIVDKDNNIDPDVTLEQLGELNFVRSGGKLEKIAMQLPFIGTNETGEEVYCVTHADEEWAKTLTQKGPKVIYCDTHDIDHDVMLRNDIQTRELYEVAYV